ncbi:MAG: hypothetical protein ACOH12_05410 [Parvibaculaceae bacterium]
MRHPVRQDRAIRNRAIHSYMGAALLIAALSGCTVVQGDTASLDNMKTASEAPAAAAPTATNDDALATASLYEASIASSGIPIPLISPRHLDVKVASISPGAGINAVSMGVPMAQLAGVYLAYDQTIDKVEGSKLNTPKDVRKAIQSLRIATPETLADGWLSIRAMAAANSATFAEGVRNEVRINGKDKVLKMLEDPAYVLRIPGASAAMSAVMDSGKAEDERLAKLRKRFIETAFSFQKQKWGMTEPMEGAAEVKTADANTTTLEKVRGFMAALSPISEAQAYSVPVMAKILARGARESIAAPIIPISGGPDETSSCLNWARLNLNQCVAAAHFPSEEAWCAGTHGIEEVRACWAAALPTAGATPH